MERAQWKWLGISIAFSVVVLVLVLYFTIDESTIDYLKKLDPFYLILALLVHIFSMVLWALRLKFMARPLGYPVPFLHCLNMVNANLLIAAVTPSQAGGEPVRIHELHRADVPIGDATAIVIMERVLDGIVLGTIGAISALLLWIGFTELDIDLATPMAITWVLLSIFLVVFAYSVKNPEFLKSLLKKISMIIGKRWHPKKLQDALDTIDREVDNFNGALVHFTGHAKGSIGWGLLFTILFWVSEFSIASLILMGLGEAPHLLESFIVQIVIAVIMMIPLTPGSSGVAELSATSLYGLFVPSAIVGVFVVLWRLILYYSNIVIGLIATVVIVKREVVMRTLKSTTDKIRRN